MVMEISSGKKAKKKLKLISKAVEEAPDAIIIIDIDAKVVYANKAAIARVGYDEDELHGANVVNLMAEKGQEDAFFNGCLKVGRWEGKASFKNKSGEYFPATLSTSLMRDEQGRPIAIICILHPIVKSNGSGPQNEGRQGQDPDACAAVSNLAHDLSNVMAVILGRIQLLQMKEKKENLQAELKTIENAAMEGAEMIKHWREFSSAPIKVEKHGAVDFSANGTKGDETAQIHLIDMHRKAKLGLNMRLRSDTMCNKSWRAAKRILIVEDEQETMRLIKDLLKAEGYSVATAEGGKAAINLLQSEMFDLIFTDLVMPGINGWEIALFAKKAKPDVPVILGTGWGTMLDKKEVISRGVDLVLSKPYDIRQLLASIEKMLTKERPEIRAI